MRKHKFISLISNAPLNFTHRKPTEQFLLNNRIALFSDSYQHAISIVNNLPSILRGILLTKGKLFSCKRIGDRAWHLVVTNDMLPHLSQLAISYLEILAISRNSEIVESNQKEILDEKDASLFELFDQSPIPQELYDGDGNRLRVNASWENLWNTKASLLGTFNILRDRNFNFLGINDQIAKSFEGKNIVVEEVWIDPVYNDEDWSNRCLRITANAIKSQNGKVKYVVVASEDITDLAKSVRRAKESENKYRDLVESMSEGVLFANKHYHLTYANKSISKMLGMTQNDLIGKNIKDLMDEPNKKIMLTQRKKRIEGNSTRYELSFHSAQGKDVSTVVSAHTIYDDNGKSAGAWAIISDLTKRKKAEKELRKSEENLRTTLYSIGDAVISTNLDSAIIRMNPVAEKLTGWKQKDAIGKRIDSVFRIVNVLTKIPVRNPVNYVLEKGKQVELSNNTLLISKEGSEYQISDSASPILNDEGDLTGVVLVFRDVSDAYKNQERLKANEERFREMTELLPVGVFEYNLEMSITYANTTAIRLFGYTRDDGFIGKNIYDLIDPKEWEYAKNNIGRRLRGEKLKMVEYCAIRKDKSTFPTMTYINPIIVDDKIQGFRGALVDITPQKLAEKKFSAQNEKLTSASVALKKSNANLKIALLKAEKSRELQVALNQLKDAQSKLVESEKMASVGLLSAGIAHEINNPLNFIEGGKSALVSHFEDNIKNKDELAKVMSYIEMIDTGIKKTTNIVQSLNQFSRKSENHEEVCDLHVIIENCLTILQSKLKYKIDIVKEFSVKQLFVKGNDGELHQVILNILNNSVQAIEHSGTIKIMTSLTKSKVVLEFEDNGHGIKPENLNNVVEPFFTTRNPGAGTGLGMSISYNIIKKHNGSIMYGSEIGKGTIVTVKFNKMKNAK